MASEESQLPPPPRAPWRALFQSHISKLASPEFSLATLYADFYGNVFPRARTCIFRGFWADLDLRETAKKQLLEDERTHQDSGINPSIYESDLLTFTTDVRMETIHQMNLCIVEGKQRSIGTGGEGPIEAVFWVKDAMTQWRIRGKVYVIGADSKNHWELEARSNIQQWVRRKEGSTDKDAEEWSWEREITAHFANLSPMMRGSFKNPPPGSPMSEPPTDPSLKLGQKVDDLHDPVARANFRVVVVVPKEVERVDLTSPEESKRARWTLIPDDDYAASEPEEEIKERTWKSVELWP
ncbi:hypothetical protein AJ79_07641 [Helicocarpus griseus UAMH5409]|uniref:Pyridoxamine 5'-phosphate oxidase Alr4036 family FMN-binding domain-containing protein n=1 Tax=Helicocarpus griseus UAMH5409 TaxID=1447875 RepID=A0A2B7X0J7_9EURO|nr:hypothetical protein AJ79_07641 [Helicocarpus griseus UAMH5409]